MATKKVIVTVYEMHAVTHVVEVDWNGGDPSVRELAIQKANELIELGAEPVSFEYSHTLDTDEWNTCVIE